MPTTANDGVRIAYDEAGDGTPIVLVHGFAADRRGNWKATGWYDALVDSGRRVVGLDCRGHGASAKPHDPDAYGVRTMAGDVIAVMDDLGIETAELHGYSMGGRISMTLLADHGDRFTAAVLGGVGPNVGRRRGGNVIAETLEAEAAPEDAPAQARAFRDFAEANGNDLRALAACMRGLRAGPQPDLGSITTPTLVVCGTGDDLVGHPQPIVDAIDGAALEMIPDRDHLTTVPDDRYKQAAIAFLDERRA